jgi:hypothetical protein
MKKIYICPEILKFVFLTEYGESTWLDGCKWGNYLSGLSGVPKIHPLCMPWGHGFDDNFLNNNNNKSRENLLEILKPCMCGEGATEIIEKFKQIKFDIVNRWYSFENLDDDIICYCFSSNFNELVIQELVKNKELKIPDICVYISILNNNTFGFNALVKSCNKEVDLKSLNFACMVNNPEIIHYILNEKVKPQKIHFDILVRNYNDYDPKGDIKTRIINNNKCFSLLMNFGYNITQSDFDELLEKCLYLENYKKYNLIITDEIKKKCNIKGFIDVDNNIDIDIDIDGYNMLIAHENLNTIIKIEKKYNLNPNSKSLCSALKNKNYKIVKYLICVKKIIPDLDCLLGTISCPESIRYNIIVSYYNHHKK